ncbi:MAG: transposase [Candidatus Cloacimonetes bacterium]|nr:transposase [Candidatus Cloacimonadota bacterium]
MAEAIKTIKIKIVNPNKGKEEALESTLEILNSCLSTYIDLTLQHRSLLSAQKEFLNKRTGEVRLRPLYNSEILTELEKLSLPTVAHPYTSINIKFLFPGLPTNFRRSIINTAVGMVKSYLSNLKKWEEKKKGKPPKPPAAFNLPTFYKGTYQFQNIQEEKFRIELLDIKNQFVRLKVFDGSKRPIEARSLPHRNGGSDNLWIWKNYPVKIGRKQLNLLNDPNWSSLSPTLVPKRKKRIIEWYIHIPLVKKVSVLPISEQKKDNPNLTTLAVDLGLRHLAVVTVRQNGKIVFVKFFRGEKCSAHRFSHLQKVFKKQHQSGKPVIGERSNKAIWRHIRSTNTDVAHNITREIVEIAQKYDVKVILLEHLSRFQPKKGEKRSKKLNRKLTYWLKGKIEEQLRYKSFFDGILVSCVNPAFTSKICNKCGGFGERFSNKSLFRCFYCGYCANADFNASVNLHKVFWDIFSFPKKKKYKKPARKGKGIVDC